MRSLIMFGSLALALAGCGGGGASTAAGTPPNATMPPLATPVAAPPVTTPSPVAVPAPPGGAAPASTLSVLGSNAFVNPANSLTLYVFDADPTNGGVSNCNGACAGVWPPFLAPANAQPTGAFTVIHRADRTLQWALGGRPLYNYTIDRNPGDGNGNGIDSFNGIWHIARP